MNHLSFVRVFVLALLLLGLTLPQGRVHSAILDLDRSDSAQEQTSQEGLREQTPGPTPAASPDQQIRLKTELVTLTVSVTDHMGKFITGLDRDKFEIYEDKVKQSVSFFASEDAPLSVGIILDVSGSMRNKIARAREAVRRFVEKSNPEDEFFAIAFNNRPELLAEYADGETLISYMPFMRAKGRTAMFDATYWGIEKVRQGRYKRRALLVISDGQDNSSRYTYGELRKLLKEAGIQVYTIGLPDPTGYHDMFEEAGLSILRQISSLTGGRSFTVMSASFLESLCGQIATELRQQYSIGYVSTNAARDGQWRKIKVEVNGVEKGPKLKVHAKAGYFAPLGQQ